jgi:stearoyl-CoA desaturase (delta-9 desaturase)
MVELIYTLIATHITILCVTLYLHRGQAHRGVTFHPVITHFMRFWLWLTTSMITKEWVAIHRKHHRYTEKEGDPHSPHVFGILKVLFLGAWLYNEASKDKKMLNQYGVGSPNDWIENNLYSKYTTHGIILLLIINTLIFNGWGIVIWLIQMAWIPFWAAGVINGVGHYVGYRNNNTNDKSKNIFPIAILIGGEELHNNHHNDPASIKLSQKWYEFDYGYAWINLLMFLRLAKCK